MTEHIEDILQQGYQWLAEMGRQTGSMGGIRVTYLPQETHEEAERIAHLVKQLVPIAFDKSIDEAKRDKGLIVLGQIKQLLSQPEHFETAKKVWELLNPQESKQSEEITSPVSPHEQEKAKERTEEKLEKESPVHVHTQPLATEIPQVDHSKIEQFNAELSGRGSKLRCLEFQDLSDPLRVDPERQRATLESRKQTSIKDVDVYEALFQNVQIISYDEFKRSLVSCAHELDRLIGDRPYALGYAEFKSNKWVAEQALPFLTHPPQSDFSVKASSHEGSSQQGDIDPHIDQFVLFDDVSYSGSQIAGDVLFSLIDKIPPGKKVDIYVVIPFMSEQAKTRILDAAQKAQNAGKMVSVHIISSDIPVKMVNDVFPAGSRGRGLFMESRCVALPEWKRPDSVSVPGELTEIVTGGHPPYKPPKETA